MRNLNAENSKEPIGNEAGPTRCFDGSVVGPGSQIGPFRIEHELGRGGAGVVYLAHDTKLDRSVAIKSLPPEVKDNPKALSRFTREARVLASLNHPNIATIHEVLERAEGLSYLVLEYIPGQTLAERITKGPLKLEETLTIALQIAEALAAAHEHDVIHRDLKPGNIKITPKGKVKVLDFGLAKVVGGETTDHYHGSRSCNRHTGLYESRASSWRGVGCTQRPVLLRRGALRDGHRHAAVCGQEFDCHL